MPTCNITGTLRNSEGEALPNTTVSFLRNGVFSQIDSVIIERVADVTSDEFGDIEIDLLPGNYRGFTKDSRGMDISFSVGVPDADAADLADIINSAVLLTPTTLQQAIAARDAALGFRNEAEGFRNEAEAFAVIPITQSDYDALAEPVAGKLYIIIP